MSRPPGDGSDALGSRLTDPSCYVGHNVFPAKRSLFFSVTTRRSRGGSEVVMGYLWPGVPESACHFLRVALPA